MTRIARVLALPIALASSFLSLHVLAQDAAGGAGRSTSPSIPAHLDDALERVAWDAARQGPLLVVDPKRATAANTAPLSSTDGYRLRDVAPRYGRKVVALSSLTALAPSEMVILNPRPGKPNPLAGLDRAEIARYLMALLNPSQWQKLGSTNGLGLADLTREQQIAFDALIPNPLVAKKGVTGKGGGVRFTLGGDTRLSSSARSMVRLRIMRAVSLRVPLVRDRSFLEVNSRTNRPEGIELTTVDTPAWDPTEQRPDAQGVALKATVPSRPKPSDLAFDAPALSVPVPLTGAQTVADLVKRVGEAAGIEIYADARVATLPLWTRGRAARAGDVMQVLCQAVTGTVRRIRPAGANSTYVLVDDPAGIGARCAVLADWKSDAQHQKGAVEEQIRTRIGAQPKQYLPFMENDPLMLPAETVQKVEERFAHPNFSREGDPLLYEIPLTELPPAAQDMVRTEIARRGELGRLTGREEGVREDRLVPDIQMRLFFVVPGFGLMEDINIRLGSVTPRLVRSEPPPPMPPVAPVVLPPSMRTRVLLSAPKTADEAARAVQTTRERGLTQLWVEVPRAGDDEILAAAIEAGKEHKLPVMALVRLLSLPPAADGAAGDRDRTALPRDVNILGENAAAYFRRRAAVSSRIQSAPVQDWLRGDLPGTAIALKQWVVAVARTPGLAGLVLTDTAPPLYGNPGDTSYLDSDGSWGLGYTPEMRLAFLRQERIDPVDLITPSMSLYRNDLSLPFFPDAESARRRWFAFRHETNVRLLVDLFTAIRTTRPGLPLLIRDRPEGYPDLFGYGWYAGWNKPRALPRSRLGFSDQPLNRVARAQAEPVFLTSGYREEWLSGPEANQIQEFTRSLSDILNAVKGDWDGIVLDLSAMPVNKALPLLQALAPTPAAPKR